jgi:hypothetical protein
MNGDRLLSSYAKHMWTSQTASPTGTYTDDELDEKRHQQARYFGYCCIILAIMIVVLWQLNRRNIRNLIRVRAILAERRRLEDLDIESNNAQRYQQIISKFHLQIVAKDKSNIDPEVLRSTEKPLEENEEAHQGGHVKKENVEATAPRGIRGVIAAWKNPSDVCCICLEQYCPGDTICVSKESGCDHIFHKECVFEWLKREDHNHCPLCRVDLMDGSSI